MARAARHRHAIDGGYPRGEETRARIVVAALKLFGERGFEGASTRDIAAAAGVNAPALQYYFDSKEGVYLACVEHIVSRTWELLSAVIDRGERAVELGAADAELIEAFAAIQAQLADFMFTSLDTSDWRMFLARQQAGTGLEAGFQIVYRRVSKRIFDVMAAIVGRLAGLPVDSDETRIRTMALNGQLTMFQMGRRSALLNLNWDAVDANRLLLLKRIIWEQTCTVLHSMIAARDARPSVRAGRTRAKVTRPSPSRVSRSR
ncbi:MAG TPA: CerR family C-terminal domain-containing protein [Steroidobacteraceae bacterium]